MNPENSRFCRGMRGLCKSMAIVLEALENNGKPMNGHQLKMATGIPKRTIRFATKRLLGLGLIQRTYSLKDTRITIFRLKAKDPDKP